MEEKREIGISSIYKSFCDYMRRDAKGPEIGIYTVSGLLFAVAYYKIRPITKFRNPFDIPKHFIRDKIVQNGRIVAVQPTATGPVLRVNHRPPINLLFASKRTLPVKISGIQLNANGFSWLQSVAINKDIKFVPLFLHNDSAECQVLIKNHPSQKLPIIDCAESLLSLGFARTVNHPPMPEIDEKILKYYEGLAKIQNSARRNRKGMWADSVPPPPWPVRQIQNATTNAILRLLPANYRLPQLVR